MVKSSLRKKRVGVTGQSDMFPDIPGDMSVIHFPVTAQQKRVVLSRPTPQPVQRICPFCGAIFLDYTQRANTTYDRSSCRVRMSELKRERAIVALAAATNATPDAAALVMEGKGLPAVEKLLKQFGYSWVGKEWVK